MTQGLYHHLRQAWKKPDEKRLRELMINWRAGQSITKLERPTRIDKARMLGYKAKKGFVIYRVTLQRGGRAKARPRVKRRSKRFSVKKILRMSYQWVAEQRVQNKFSHLCLGAKLPFQSHRTTLTLFTPSNINLYQTQR